MKLGALVTISVALAASGCGGPLAQAPRVDVATWGRARARLAELQRDAGSAAPKTRRVTLALREPFTGRLMQARGAVATSPPDGLRMILVGPGGTTALDLWLGGDRFRFVVPAIDLVRRGDASTPPEQTRGLPVGFLRWWLLRPFGGTLQLYAREPGGERFLLRDGGAWVDLRVGDDGRLAATRTTRVGGAIDEETVVAARVGCGAVRYTQRSTHLDIAVTCEGEETRPPSPRAFVDPDAAGARP